MEPCGNLYQSLINGLTKCITLSKPKSSPRGLSNRWFRRESVYADWFEDD